MSFVPFNRLFLLKKTVFFLVGFLLFWQGDTVAKTLDLEGQDILYDTYSQEIIASNNVTIRYKTHEISTQIGMFSLEKKTVNLPSDFLYTQGPTTLFGESLFYTMEANTGYITTFVLRAPKTYVSGMQLEIAPTRLIAKNVRFTSCNAPTPDYYIQSESLQVYPQIGLVVGFNNTVHLPILPFPLWVPTFVYGSQQYGLLATAGVPDIGTNEREGWYIKQRVAYFLNEYNTGAFNLGWYIQKGGMLYGINHMTALSNDSQLGVGAHVVGHDGIEGNVVYQHSLQKTHSTQDTEGASVFPFQPFFSELGNPVAKTSTQLEIGGRYRQLENDSRVSQLPFTTLQIYDTPLIPDWFFSGDFGWADITEETPDSTKHQTSRTYSHIRFIGDYPVTASVNAGVLLTSQLQWYGEGSSWHRFFATSHVRMTVGVVTPTVFYTKRLLPTKSNSPFVYEQKYAVVSDELGYQVTAPFLGVDWTLEGFYDLEQHQWRTQDIATALTFHCWRLSLKAQLIQKRVAFGVELL